MSFRGVVVVALASMGLLACGSPEPTMRTGQAVTIPAPRAATLIGLTGPWQAEPFELDAGFRAAVDQACRTDPAGPLPAALVVTDARGDGRVILLYATDLERATCFVTVGVTGDIECGCVLSTSRLDGARALEPGQLVWEEQFGVGGRGDGGWSSVTGRAGPGIEAVVIRPPGQPAMLASMQNGWFATSWTGSFRDAGDIHAIGLDAGGREVTTLTSE